VQADALLARVERTAVLVCGVMAAAAAALAGGRLMPILAVVAGGILALVSYRSIRSSAGALAASIGIPASEREREVGAETAASPVSRPSPGLAAAKVAGRYALLTLLAYVMIARLRLPPLGLLAGASSVVAAVAIEAVRFLLTKTP
jgi:hypothetical protein